MEQGTITEESAKVRHDAKETSRQAALRVAPKTKSLRFEVLHLFVQAGPFGLTDDEMFERSYKSPNSLRPRRVELVEGGWLCDSGTKRLSSYGNPAIVWFASHKACTHFVELFGA